MYDEEYAKESKWFFNMATRGRFQLVVSKQVVDEITPAPDRVKAFYTTTLPSLEYLDASPEVMKLADLYIAWKVLTEKYRSDAMHIAYATIYKCDGIVSWNFNHMVDLDRSIRYNMINAENGYTQLFLSSPREVEKHENA